MTDMNKILGKSAAVLHAAAFVCIAAVVIVSPWCFGSWEMWWFWPMAAVVFAGALFAGAGTLLRSFSPTDPGDELADRRLRNDGMLALLLAFVLPFLLYAFWRAGRPTAPGLPLVEMEAERSLMLFATPVLLVVTLFLTATKARVRALFVMFLTNAVAIAVTAGVNHALNGSSVVLWVEAYKYGGRASIPFFCPNHLAAYLNIALCGIVAVVLTPRTRRTTRGVLAVLALPIAFAWFLTLSRGGTASLFLTVPLMVLLVGLRGYRWRTRLVATFVVVVLTGSTLRLALTVNNPLLTRLKNHAFIQFVLKGEDVRWETVKQKFFTGFDRGLYIGSAIRAWRTSPVVGIGPGQHAIRWPQFAASEDGIRATAKWPERTNHEYYLYEVHSDWMQLLEEYGTVGLALFLVAFVGLLGVLLRAQGKGLRAVSKEDVEGSTLDRGLPLDRSLPLAALLSLAVFTAHSLGDFSLQIPAITWSLAIVVGCGLLATLPERGHGSTRERHSSRHASGPHPTPSALTMMD